MARVAHRDEHEPHGRIELVNSLYWTFDELLGLATLWGLNGGPGAIYIERPTANRSGASYPEPD